MTNSELLRKLRRAGAGVVAGRGRGGHVMVMSNDRRTFAPTGTGEIKRGTLLGILEQFGLRLEDWDRRQRWPVLKHRWLGQ